MDLPGLADVGGPYSHAKGSPFANRQPCRSIESEIVKPTKQIVLNSVELKIAQAKVSVDHTKSTQGWESTNVTYDEAAQRATITFDQDITVSKKAAVVIAFEGIINNDMAGFYRSKYKPVVTPADSVPRDDEWHYMFSTQFESCDARRAFPCFDEPNLKATYDFEIEIPNDQVALSNMPVKETKPTKEGWQLVSFERTPIMSSYLLAWAVGDFEYVEAFTERRYNGKQLPVRVYTTRGLKEQGRYALEHAPKTIDYFSEIFDIDYPLPKSDLLAVHEFTHGAMENWGLVTYRTTRVLFDEKTASARLKNDIAYVVAHELAHQWFGNLVTMDWWDELWLNEGFATWVGWLAVDHIHPEWEVWAQFVNEGFESAFKMDGIRSSHPIHVPVRDALDVNQIFDAISYLKGCSSIRMLANHLGIKTFLKGVSNYLKAHAYGNAKTKALWDALSEASGKNVNEIMGPWISKIGHPVVTVAEEPDQITVKQTRFLSTGDVKPDEDTTTWWLPLAIEGKKGHQGIAELSMTTKEETIRDVDTEFYKLNSGATGFYRVNYPPARLNKLSSQLDKLSIADRIAIIGSATEMAFSGHGTTASLLNFLQGFTNEPHSLVWKQITDSLASVHSVFAEDKDLDNSLKKFTVNLLDKKVKEIGWDYAEGEDYLTSEMRSQLIYTAVNNGHPEYVFVCFLLWTRRIYPNVSLESLPRLPSASTPGPRTQRLTPSIPRCVSPFTAPASRLIRSALSRFSRRSGTPLSLLTASLFASAHWAGLLIPKPSRTSLHSTSTRSRLPTLLRRLICTSWALSCPTTQPRAPFTGTS